MKLKSFSLLIIAIGVLTVRTGFSQSENSIRFMFYNTENFFDINDDSISDDNEFLPGGAMKWNHNRYTNKLVSLYKTIVAAGDWNPPPVIALCEIENRHVLEDLLNKTYLSKYDYNIVHQNSPDPRGIDVCLIYRKSMVSVLFYNYWIPPDFQHFDSRSTLYVKLLVRQDTIHLIANHWPSKRGGVLAGYDKKLAVSLMVKQKIDSISESHHRNAFIILLGDFNCSPDDELIKSMITSPAPRQQYVNLADEPWNKGLGTYRYAGVWEMFDQMIISKNLFACIGTMTIFSRSFIMVKDDKYPGFSPFPTYSGYKYRGGFSDHLPVLLDLKTR